MYGLENFGITDSLETVSFKTLYYVNKKDVCTHCNLYNSPMEVPYVLKTENKIYEIYKKGATLIFPSLVESLGLPLVEAREIGIDIIAPERDYVRDVVSPVETFDPLSPLSISRAVKRYLKVSDRSNNLLSPAEVLKKIF